jgi:hypothetical protein
VQPPRKELDRVGEEAQPRVPIRVVAEDLPAFVPARGDVPDSAGMLQA